MSEWVDISEAGDFNAGDVRLVEVDDTRIAVINIDGEYFALKDVCSHEGFAMLGCGLDPDELIHGDELQCPRHGARFSIRTGEALLPPACEPLDTYEVRIHDGMVQIKAPDQG